MPVEWAGRETDARRVGRERNRRPWSGQGEKQMPVEWAGRETDARGVGRERNRRP